VVALTFDDGPDPQHTPRILDLLAEHGAGATFFVFGVKARRNRELIARALEAGHEVQPHCWADHVSHLRMSEAEIEVEIERTVRTLTHLGCPPPQLWRPPYGDVREPETRTVAARHGLEVVTWTLDTLDWSDDRALGLDAVDAQLEPDAVVLMHDTIPRTAELLAGLLERLEERGLEAGPMAARAETAERGSSG
jgi:peptidoglycan/xylan/chitin deacetylase (PgdA/CDA1 family)